MSNTILNSARLVFKEFTNYIINMANNNHGGARDGAGRKKVGDGILYVKMPQAAVDKIKASAKAEKKALGEYLQDALHLR